MEFAKLLSSTNTGRRYSDHPRFGPQGAPVVGQARRQGCRSDLRADGCGRQLTSRRRSARGQTVPDAVEDVFTITGRARSARERVERGQVKVGEEIEIVGLVDTPPARRCQGIEMFRKLLDAGIAGDNVGVLLRGVERNDIERVRCWPSPVRSTHKKFKAKCTSSRKKRAAATPVLRNYRPQFYFRTTDVTEPSSCRKASRWSCRATTSDGRRNDHVDRCEEGLRFAIREAADPSAPGRHLRPGLRRHHGEAENSYPAQSLRSRDPRSVRERIVDTRSHRCVRQRPVPLPTEINRVCVLRSPHVDKKSRDIRDAHAQSV